MIMKVRGQIRSVTPIDGAAALDVMLRVELTGAGKIYTGGRDHPVFVQVNITADRAALKDYTIGDFFDVAIEVNQRRD
jgi:hypothetical protein